MLLDLPCDVLHRVLEFLPPRSLVKIRLLSRVILHRAMSAQRTHEVLFQSAPVSFFATAFDTFCIRDNTIACRERAYDLSSLYWCASRKAPDHVRIRMVQQMLHYLYGSILKLQARNGDTTWTVTLVSTIHAAFGDLALSSYTRKCLRECLNIMCTGGSIPRTRSQNGSLL